MDDIFKHYLKPDHNGEPICACGFDPAQEQPAATNRGEAIDWIYDHKQQEEHPGPLC